MLKYDVPNAINFIINSSVNINIKTRFTLS